MRIGEWDFPDHLLYDRFHQWCRKEEGDLVVGVTHYACDTAGDVLYVELPEPGGSFRQGEPMGSIEAGKWVGRIYAAVDGMVLEVNHPLSENPRPVNLDPYGGGWLVRLRPVGDGVTGDLLQGDSYRNWLEAELSREPRGGKTDQ